MFNPMSGGVLHLEIRVKLEGDHLEQQPVPRAARLGAELLPHGRAAAHGAGAHLPLERRALDVLQGALGQRAHWLQHATLGSSISLNGMLCI